MSAPYFTGVADIQNHRDTMEKFFETGATKAVSFRRVALQKLKAQLKANEGAILDALTKDLGKAPFEGYATELGIVYDEINMCLAHLESWARPRRVPTSILHFHSTSTVYPEPIGVALILSPWNYPIQLALVPMVDAIAAGCCVMCKPSRSSQATSELLPKLIDEIFPSEYICVSAPSAEINDWLLHVQWDHIFFTGSPRVGKTIMAAAAEHLTPVTLELGGKSPCIVDKSAHIRRAAQRIAWGKGINSGQTCVAPDYLLVHTDIADELTAELNYWFHRYYGADILQCPEWPHMINRRAFDRVVGLIENRNPLAYIAFGGRSDPASLRIEPTCLRCVNLDDPVMGEEIFGPVLPMLSYQNLDEAFAIIRHFEKPLACYVFSEEREVWERVIREIPFGGATINDCVIHLANNHMGFGGVGASGMGSYHGKCGFDCFTHYKSTLRKTTLFEIPIRVPPFGKKLALLKLMMR